MMPSYYEFIESEDQSMPKTAGSGVEKLEFDQLKSVYCELGLVCRHISTDEAAVTTDPVAAADVFNNDDLSSGRSAQFTYQDRKGFWINVVLEHRYGKARIYRAIVYWNTSVN
jgi:hypothetical protein